MSSWIGGNWISRPDTSTLLGYSLNLYLRLNDSLLLSPVVLVVMQTHDDDEIAGMIKGQVANGRMVAVWTDRRLLGVEQKKRLQTRRPTIQPTIHSNE